ncbi:MAG: amidohydrolase, partial [Candidatus Cloacimonetes bacterium]|nr:amidohydrolase [Candidatus Cloacimonadota bacterium]
MKLFYNAKFYSMRKKGEYFSAILTENGKIIETFTKTPKRENVEKIDLQDSFVYPGFIDTHTHSFEGGLYSLSANLENVKNLDEVFQIIAETKPISDKIFAFHFDENSVLEKRFPTKIELDKISPDIPLIIRRVDGHSCVINSKATEMIDWEKPLPTDFNGHLFKRQNGKASNWFNRNLSDEFILKAYSRAAKIAVENGHTTVHTMVGNGFSDLKHFQLIKDNLNKFPVEFILYPQISDVQKALSVNSPRIGGCILADGSFGSYTAALSEPYSDNNKTSGILYRSDEFWQNFIQKAHQNNLQIAIHCIGDKAIEQILKFYEKVESENPKNLKHIIIHNELTSNEILDRIAKARVSVSMQPMFDRLWAGKDGLYENRLGKKRTLQTNRLASIFKRNILLAGGSDWYITDLNALQGINAATKMHNKNEQLTPFQATEIYTKKAAEISNDDTKFGTLEKQKQADFVVLKNDIFNEKNIDKIKILATIKKG